MSPVLTSIIYGLAAAAGWGVADLFAAALSKRLGVVYTATGVHVTSCLAATVYFIWVHELGLLSVANWLELAGLSVLGMLMYIAFYSALRVGPVALISPIVAAYAVVVIALSLMFAGETLNLIQILGAVGTIGGIVTLSFEPGVFLNKGRNNGRIIGIGIALAIVTALGIGIWQYGVGILSRDVGWFLPVYVSRMMTLGLLIPMSIILRQWRLRALTIPLVLGVIITGIVETGGFFAFARGSEVGAISIVAAASVAYPIIPMLGGIAIFGEHLARHQWIGLGVTLTGLFVLVIAS